MKPLGFTGQIHAGAIEPCDLLGFSNEATHVRESALGFGGSALYFNTTKDDAPTIEPEEPRIIRIKYAGATMKITVKDASLNRDLDWILKKFITWYEHKKGEQLQDIRFQDLSSSTLLSKAPSTLYLIKK